METFKRNDWIAFNAEDLNHPLRENYGRIVDNFNTQDSADMRYYIKSDDGRWFLRQQQKLRLLTDGEIMLLMFERPFNVVS